MDWMLLLLIVPLGALCWWAAFVATARYRKNKHLFKEDD